MARHGIYGLVRDVYQSPGNATVVDFAGRDGRVVTWRLVDIERQARATKDPEIRAEWVQLERDARQLLSDKSRIITDGPGPSDWAKRL